MVLLTLILLEVLIQGVTTGYFFTIGGIVVNWISTLQKVNALSITEVEYVATTKASKEIIRLQCFLDELGQN